MEKIRILIAEDDKSLQETYDCFLSSYAFDKRFTANGKELLEAYGDEKPDLMLLDSIMPVMTGYTALKTIRTLLGDRVTPAVILTSLSKSDDVMDFVKIGISGYLIKPISPQELGAQVLKYYEKISPTQAKEALNVHNETIKKWREEFEQKQKQPEQQAPEADPVV